jgi:alpha-L-rhamnosidase
MHCIEWVQRDNLHGVPTDCPQRDEREGWMGDIQAFSQTAIYGMDMAAFFTKWVRDIRDSVADNGAFPDVAPHPTEPNVHVTSSPAWADAGTIVPWRAYQNYADVRLLEEHFVAAKRWVDFVHANNPNLLWLNGRGGDHGDWLNADSLLIDGYPQQGNAVPKDVLATAFFAHSTEIVAKMASVLGQKDDAKKYGQLLDRIKVAFNKEYVTADGRIKGDSQGGYALALQFNLLDVSLRSKATEHLLAAIKRYKGHSSTGIQTTHHMMLALSENGYNDEAWRLINLRTPPSWGYMIDQGATTIWERWDGIIKGRNGQWGEFQHPDMNSFNHWAFGSVGEWVWRELVGIHCDEDQPGYKHFVLHPRPCTGLAWAKARYDSIRGPIVSEWKMTDGQFQFTIEVPANTTATVYIPAVNADAVTESDKLAAKADGVAFVGMNDGDAVFSVESGRYNFQAKCR